MPSENNTTFQGQFYDGQSAMAHRVVARLSTNMVVMTDEDGTLTNWGYGDLLAPEPITASKATRLTHVSAPYARLVIEDPAFAKAIVARAPHLSARSARLNSFRLIAACIAGAVLLVVATLAMVNFAPRQAALVMPDSWRDHIGKQVLATFAGTYSRCDNVRGVAALNELHQRLGGNSDDDPVVSVDVYDIPIMNAFALPGGRIVITQALIDKVSGPDSVAGVLAHEIGHSAARDPEAQLIRFLGLNLLRSVVFGSSTVGEAIGSAAGYLTLMNYSREAEWRADEYAMDLLRDAEISRSGLLDFFRLVQEETGGADAEDSGYSDLTRFANSHPGTAERIRAIEALEPWTSRRVISDARWRELQRICS